ncbi:MAG: PKD domain-containing protein [Candidatus Peregrinibacteria bacterium]
MILPSPLRYRLFSVLVLTLALCVTGPARAEVQSEPFTVQAGAVFEILADSPRTGTSVAWTLTKADGTFVQADRGKIFRERFIEIGDYTLSAQMSGSDRATLAERTFTIHVTEPSTASPAAGTPGGALVVTDPTANENGIVVINPGQDLLLLTPSFPGQMRLSLDLGSGAGTDADGTFFQTDATALRIWFTEPQGLRTITVLSTESSGTQSQIISLSFGPPAVPTPTPEPGSTPASVLGMITAEDRGNGSYAFSLNDSTIVTTGRALLFLWDFGDGRQSMLDHPVHTFGANGSFPILLNIQDLQTSQEILKTNGTLTVTSVGLVPITTSSASSAAMVSSTQASSIAAEPPSSVDSQNSSKGWSLPISAGLLKNIGIGAGVLLVTILLGIGIVSLLARIVRHSMEKKEGTIVSEGKTKSSKSGSPRSKAEVLENTAPMSVIDVSASPERPGTDFPERPTPSPEPVSKPAKKPMPDTPPIQELTFDEQQAPAWLRVGHTEAEKKGVTVTTPPTLIDTAAPSEIPGTAENAAPSISATPQEESAAVPSWLSASAQSQDPFAPSPSPVEPSPQPSPPITPAPSFADSSPSPSSVITPAASPADEIPDWLNPGSKSDTPPVAESPLATMESPLPTEESLPPTSLIIENPVEPPAPPPVAEKTSDVSTVTLEPAMPVVTATLPLIPPEPTPSTSTAEPSPPISLAPEPAKEPEPIAPPATEAPIVATSEAMAAPVAEIPAVPIKTPATPPQKPSPSSTPPQTELSPAERERRRLKRQRYRQNKYKREHAETAAKPIVPTAPSSPALSSPAKPVPPKSAEAKPMNPPTVATKPDVPAITHVAAQEKPPAPAPVPAQPVPPVPTTPQQTDETIAIIRADNIGGEK